MQSSFLLCGLPRSRLYWLSRFLTVLHQSVCLCDGLCRATSAQSFWEMAEAVCQERGVRIFGNSEILNLPLLPSLLAARPMTKVVWIHRPMLDSIKAAEAAGYHIPVQIWQAMAAHLTEYLEHVDWIVPFDLLDHESTMRMLWEKVLPGLEWNQRRWQAFTRKRIVCNPALTINIDSTRLARFLEAEIEPIVLPPLG
jgi:hypothetical protein